MREEDREEEIKRESVEGERESGGRREREIERKRYIERVWREREREEEGE